MKAIAPTKALLFIVVWFAIMIVDPTHACTVFNSSDSENVLFGNVENEQPHLVTEIHFKPANEKLGHYGNFYFFGENGNIGGGMNDQGLCFDVAALPDHNAYPNRPYGDLMEYLLTRCSTVAEALDFFKDFNWYGHRFNHIMIMDKTGKSVVVEHLEYSIRIFPKEGESQVMTNYSIADPEIRLGDYPCSRFEKATSMLDTAAVTVSNFQKICNKVAHAYYNALYANIYNPKTLDIHIFNPNIPNTKITTFNLPEELKMGSHFYLIKDNQILLGVPELSNNMFSISENAPNPFSYETSFSLDLATDARVKISALDMHGREIEVFENGRLVPGTYSYNWQTADLPSGMYLCRFQIDGIIETRKWLKQ